MTTKEALNPELVKAIEQLLPGCPGLAEATIRIYYMHTQAERFRRRDPEAVGALNYEIFESPEGRICDYPRVVTVMK